TTTTTWERPLGVMPAVLAFALGLSFITSVLSGILPALAATRTDLLKNLKQGGSRRSGASNRGLRRALVVTDVALAMILLAGAALMLESMVCLFGVPAGFVADKCLTV